MKKIYFIVLLFALIACKEEDEKKTNPIENVLPPKACFTYELTDFDKRIITFLNCSEDASNYYWDFGDGFTSTDENPEHTYNQSNDYKVKLICSNQKQQDTIIQWVEVPSEHHLPVVDFRYEINPDNPGEVRFFSFSKNAESFLWDFGNGKTSDEAKPVITYNVDGNSSVTDTINVSLTASNKYGSSTCTKQVFGPKAICAFFGFDITENNLEIQFFNYSTNATKHLWLFGDSTSSTEENPIHVFNELRNYTVTLIAYNETLTDTFKMDMPFMKVVYKPNIYIYPLEEIDLEVKLGFPQGGKVICSIPEYGNSWNVNVAPDGTIDNQYKYLFYESTQPDGYQYNTGWCISKDDLTHFFENNMKKYNFSQPEINDFTDYWIPKLNDSPYYKIYPQTNEIIDKLIELQLSKQADNIGRLFYCIEPSTNYVDLNEPEIIFFRRDGYFVMEWGVVLD